MTEAKSVEIGSVRVSNAGPLTLIAGPCQLEGLDHALAIAEPLAEACAQGRGRVHLQGVLRQGEPHVADGRAGHRHGRGAADAGGGAERGSDVRC